MKLQLALTALEFAAKYIGPPLVEAILNKARAWAESDGKEDWDDEVVEILETVAEALLKKYWD